MKPENEGPGWLDEFEDLAEEQLGDGSACKQVHPIIEKWYQEWLDDDDEPEVRSSVEQAMSCLTTEIVSNTPDAILNALLENCDEDEVLDWVQNILATGKAFQTALDNGNLDDL